MLQTSVVSPQVSSFILNTQIADSAIPKAFFGLRSVDVPDFEHDESKLAVVSDQELGILTSQMSFSDFVNFSATNERNVSILRSDYLIKKIFDRDKSVQELLILRDLLKRSEYFALEHWEYQPHCFITKCPNRVFDEGLGQLKFKYSNEFNDLNARNTSKSIHHNRFNFFVRDLYNFARDESIHSSWRAFFCDRIVKINNAYGTEDNTLGFDRANKFLTFSKNVDQADYDDNRIKLTKLFDFMITKPNSTELNKFIEENMS